MTPHTHPLPCRATLGHHFSSWTFGNFLDKWFLNDALYLIFGYLKFDIPSFVPLCSMPAALRRPQQKQVLDFQSMSYLRNHWFLYFLVFAPCAACLRRFADLKKKPSWIFRAYQEAPRRHPGHPGGSRRSWKQKVEHLSAKMQKFPKHVDFTVCFWW